MLTVSQNICNLLVQNKAEAVYSRTDASYQQFISEEDFVNDWKQLSESANITEKSKITVNFGKDNLKTMTNVYARLKGKSDIYIKFTFPSTAVCLPISAFLKLNMLMVNFRLITANI